MLAVFTCQPGLINSPVPNPPFPIEFHTIRSSRQKTRDWRLLPSTKYIFIEGFFDEFDVMQNNSTVGKHKSAVVSDCLEKPIMMCLKSNLLFQSQFETRNWPILLPVIPEGFIEFQTELENIAN